MTEMQGAVALAQLERLTEFTEHRSRVGSRLSQQLENVEGIEVQRVHPGSTHSYFLLSVQVGSGVPGLPAEELAALRQEGVNARAQLITGGRACLSL
jgi:dTDP-4-amino-4,6-dideoxygalactose transaminase